MSGLPGSGKSTLGQRLAELLELEFLDKDDFLESLMDERYPADRAERSVLSRQADVLFRSAVERSEGAVVASFWRRPELSLSSGTPFEWLADLPETSVSEVHCRCPANIALSRFVARRRHPGHHDIRAAGKEDHDRFEAQAALGPLGLGDPIVVDTSTLVAESRVAEVVEAVDQSLPI